MEIRFDAPLVCPVVIGRTTELTGMRALLEQANSGAGQVILLAGEAGIGKSRLVAETLAEANRQGFLVLQGACFPTDRSCPYAPFLDLLRSSFTTQSAVMLLKEMGPLARALFPLLPERVPLHPDMAALPPLPALDPEQEKRRLFAALAEFFTSQANKQSAILALEDLHWSDESSLELMRLRACSMPSLPCNTRRRQRRWMSYTH